MHMDRCREATVYRLAHLHLARLARLVYTFALDWTKSEIGNKYDAAAACCVLESRRRQTKALGGQCREAPQASSLRAETRISPPHPSRDQV